MSARDTWQLVNPELTKALLDEGFRKDDSILVWVRRTRDQYGNRKEGRWFFSKRDSVYQPKARGMEAFELMPCYTLSDLAMEFPLGLEIRKSDFKNPGHRWMATTSGMEADFMGHTPVEAVAYLLLFILRDKHEKIRERHGLDSGRF